METIKTLSMNNIKILNVCPKTVLIEIENKPCFIFTKHFNKLLKGAELKYILEQIENVNGTKTFVSVCSIF